MNIPWFWVQQIWRCRWFPFVWQKIYKNSKMLQYNKLWEETKAIFAAPRPLRCVAPSDDRVAMQSPKQSLARTNTVSAMKRGRRHTIQSKACKTLLFQTSNIKWASLVVEGGEGEGEAFIRQMWTFLKSTKIIKKNKKTRGLLFFFSFLFQIVFLISVRSWTRTWYFLAYVYRDALINRLSKIGLSAFCP